jgi:hypothetical protein
MAARGLCGQGIELCGRRQPFCSLSGRPLPFLEPVHELDAGQHALGCLNGLEPERRPRHPLHCPMILFQNIIEIFNLADHDCGAMLSIITPHGDGIGPTAVDGDHPRDAMIADHFREKAHGGLLIAMFGEQEIDSLACFIHRAIEVKLLAPDTDINLIHPPTAPHRPLTAVEYRLQLWAILHDPAVDGRMTDGGTPFLHEVFDRART